MLKKGHAREGRGRFSLFLYVDDDDDDGGGSSDG